MSNRPLRTVAVCSLSGESNVVVAVNRREVELTFTVRNALESLLNHVQPQHQRYRVLSRFLKTVVFVELLRAVVQGVGEQGPHARIL